MTKGGEILLSGLAFGLGCLLLFLIAARWEKRIGFAISWIPFWGIAAGAIVVIIGAVDVIFGQ